MMDDKDNAVEMALAWAVEIESLEFGNMTQSEVDDNRPDPLSIEVRSNWHCYSDTTPPMEYRIVLTTGGPAVQITGDLNDHNKPETAFLQCQNWFTHWQNVSLTDRQEEALLAYARSFYFGG